MQSIEKRQCFMDNCTNPLWVKNPLFAVLCGHHICKECVLEIQKMQEEKGNYVTHTCRV